MANNNKTSLEKSHSAWSNTKLTALCVFTILVVTLFWVSLGLKSFLDKLFLPCVIGFGILSVLCLLMFNKFKR